MNDGRSALTQALILTRPTDASVEPNLPIDRVITLEASLLMGMNGLRSTALCCVEETCGNGNG